MRGDDDDDDDDDDNNNNRRLNDEPEEKSNMAAACVCDTLASIMIQHETEVSVTCQRGFVHVNAIWLLNGTPNTL
jgi:pyrrolidone-carboxylate peptidase